MQLANLRRGLQDHQYLTLARRLGLEAEVGAALAAVVPRVFVDAGETVGFAETGETFEAARLTLAAAIEARLREGAKVKLFGLLVVTSAALALAAASRPELPKVTKSLMFDTPEADAVLAALQVFPPDNWWNRDVSGLPVHVDSERMIASIGPQKPLEYNLDMGFVIVPPDQKRVAVKLLDYANESDPGPFPLPDNAPIENWPLTRNENLKALPKPGQTLEQFQREAEGDRHVLVVDPWNGKLHEFYGTKRTRRRLAGAAGRRPSTCARARCGRSAGPPSDAAGLPVFPAVVRYDECARGMVDHAMRVTVRRTRRAFVLPATHWASQSRDPAHPRMGERIRLKKGFDIAGFPPHVQAILKGLKKHGMFVADNGSDWWMSIAPDRRLEGLETLHRVKGADFEVVETGERSVQGW